MPAIRHSSLGPSLGHSLSRPLSCEIPLRPGPRHCGQSAAPAASESTPKRNQRSFMFIMIYALRRRWRIQWEKLRMIPFADYCGRVAAHIEHTYRIRVVTVDVPDPLTGDLDGAEIHIDFALTPEQRLFLLGHLFVHTVQWNANPRAFHIGRQREP